MKPVVNKENASTLIIRLVVGGIFLSEGIQKFLLPDLLGTGRFSQIGFPHPEFWAYFTSSFEIMCSLLLLFDYFIRYASIPLLIIMITAFVTTKWPIFINKGFWAMAHEYRVDFAMTMLLLYLLIWGKGKLADDTEPGNT